tara:strand:- start:2020 stop:2379 length:360 start_codon:yes stop_codon:yes gene_type:complete
MKKRIAPIIQDDSMNRVILDIYEILNELIDNADTSKNTISSKGREGYINIVQREGVHTIEFKTSGGWYSVALDVQKKAITIPVFNNDGEYIEPNTQIIVKDVKLVPSNRPFIKQAGKTN